MNFIYAMTASLVVSLISFIGAISLVLNEKVLNKLLVPFVGLSAGGLMGGAFLHLLPEATKKDPGDNVYIWFITGFILFFLMEKILFWRHCHKGINCEIHPFVYLNLIGDAIHNFIDGLIIGATFCVDIRIGIITTIAIILHEIPQEIGDFGVLVYGGFKVKNALLFNFFSALTAVVGTATGFFVSNFFMNFTFALMPITAGGFIYIASSDLIPELNRQIDKKISFISFATFISGILFMFLVKLIH